MPTIADLCQRGAALCRTVATQDLDGLPIYIVPQSRLQAKLGHRCVLHGYTAPRLDLHLRDHISDYQGRGPCMAINDRALRAEYGDEHFDYFFLATVLHELTHILTCPWLYNEPVTASPAEIEREAREVARTVATDEPDDGRPPFHGHGAQFIRVALHLCHRAKTADDWYAPNDLCAGWRYGLSHARRYQLALGDEPGRMATMPVAKIVTAEPPGEFDQLWADDVHHYFQSRSRCKGDAP